jgi:diacylglycerol O-acyltransferase / wax synthase
VRKKVAWAGHLDLEEVKAVGKALGCTVNDVLIAVMTGALHRYLVELGDDPSSLTMRATVPVNLRPLEHARDLGNHFGLVFLDLPIAEQSAGPALSGGRIHAPAQEFEAGRDVAGTAGGPGHGADRAAETRALELFSRKASTVLTNVPGPQETLYLAGAPVKEMMVWVPQSGSIGMGISIISYEGKVFCGLMTDNKLVPDPDQVMRISSWSSITCST